MVEKEAGECRIARYPQVEDCCLALFFVLFTLACDVDLALAFRIHLLQQALHPSSLRTIIRV